MISQLINLMELYQDRKSWSLGGSTHMSLKKPKQIQPRQSTVDFEMGVENEPSFEKFLE